MIRDRGHELTEAMLRRLERDMARVYRKAAKQVAKKWEDYCKADEAKRQMQKKLLDAGQITQKDYADWVFRHQMMGKRWEDMKNVLAGEYAKADKTARGMTTDMMPDVYALNGNFATFQLEQNGRIDTSFTLYNHDAAERLLKDQQKLMPGPSDKKAREIAANKAMQWDMKQIQSAVLQGILQGESPYEVAQRLMRVGEMSYNDAVRYARTMTTAAQNAGRYDAFERAQAKGVDLTIEWQATLDSKTRDSHRAMHGQRRDVGEPFLLDGHAILWPAQVSYGGEDLPQQYIWNCRCTLLSWVKGFEGETVKHSDKLGDMSFEDWLEGKK